MSRKPDPINLPRKPQYVPMGAGFDFFELFKKLDKQFDICFMLESLGEESYISRHSIIGFDPEKLSGRKVRACLFRNVMAAPRNIRVITPITCCGI